jgi:hypothetical protein
MAEMLYQYYYGNTAVADQDIAAAATWKGQTFYTLNDADYNVSKIRLYLKRTGDVGTVTLAIRDTSGNKPSGPDLATASVVSSAIGTSYGWVDFVFATPYVLPMGTNMSFVVRATLSGGTLSVGDNDDLPQIISGYSVTSADSGGTWTFLDPGDASEIFVFQILGDDADVSSYLWGSAGRDEPWGTNYIVAPMYSNGSIVSFGPGVITAPVGNCNGLAISTDKTRIFVANGTTITAYTTAYDVDTTWGTAGIFTVGVQIYRIAVNASGQVLVGHFADGSNQIVSLINVAGSGYVWQSMPNPAVAINYDWCVAFDGSGNVVVGGWDNQGGTHDIAYRLSVVDGSLLNSWNSKSDPIKATRAITSNVDGSIIYGTYDDTQNLASECWCYVPATDIITWATALNTRYIHGVLYHSNGFVYAAYGNVGDGTISKLDADTGASLVDTPTVAIIYPGGVYELIGGHLLVFSASANAEVFDEDLVSLFPFELPSNSAGIVVLAIPPVITDQSPDTTIAVGDTLSLFVTATGTAPLSYQWYQDGNPIGTDSNTYIKAITVASDYGVYTCTVTNGSGSVTSADIHIILSPIISAQSSSSTVYNGSSKTLSVTASGGPTPTYLWYLGTNPIGGATNSTYTFYISATGTYKCRVTNTGGYVDSNPIVLTVIPNPYIGINPFELQWNLDRS